MRKRFLATLMCICMAVTLLPTAAFAQGTKTLEDAISGYKNSYEFTGYPVELELYLNAGIKLVKDVDYEISVTGDPNSLLTAAGYYDVDLLGKGDYEGSSYNMFFNIERPTEQYQYISAVGELTSDRRFAIGHMFNSLMYLNSSELLKYSRKQG